ncbi:MAG TPA: class I SAM-dependent methyltransferase [Blastocatellia bacterium]|nr:class I SAM-dependent methyltransferase [Blastocatellia bacterium]
MSSTFQADFDRIALASPEGGIQNEHYHNFLLKQVPSRCDQVLEIGCGTGTFARALAARSNHVLGIDLSPEMIRLARENSTQSSKARGQQARGQQARGQQAGVQEARGQEGGVPPLWFSNLEFQVGDILQFDLPSEHFDCIASIATLHHLPFREVLLKMKAALKPGGVLLILDLFEPQGVSDWLLNFPALSVSTILRLISHHRLRPRREVRAAWAAHEAHDLYPTMTDMRSICADLLPGAKVRKHLLWRYSIVWYNSNS